jgi:lipopolysaccharide export system permease protein
MKILDRYIAAHIVRQTVIVLAVLVGLFQFVSFIDQLNLVGRGRYGLGEAVQYVILTIPRVLYDIFPMAALLGSILGLSTMAGDSELTVMRASGVSVLRILGSVLRIGAALALVAMIIGEFVTPTTETMAQRGRSEALQERIKQQTNFGLWMRDSGSYVNIGEVLPDLTLRKLKLFEFDAEGRLRSLVYAELGRHTRQRWNLQDVRQTLLEREQTRTQQLPRAEWRTDVSPAILSVFLIKPDQLSAWQLNRYVAHLAENGQDTSSYELAYWGKIVTPISTAAMVMLAIPFVFVNLRSGSLGRNLFVGIMLGLTFYVLDKGFGYVVLVYDLPPFSGAVVPTLLFMAVGLVMLRRVV